MPMRDKRPVDELSIEELERILAVRKREARLARAKRYGDQGRVVPVTTSLDDADYEADAVDYEPAIIEVTEVPPAALAPVAIATSPLEVDEELPADLEDQPITPTYFEGDPHFEDEQPKQVQRERNNRARQRVATKQKAMVIAPTNGSVRTIPPTVPIPLSSRAKLWNRVLLGIEVAAVLGLIGLGYVLYQSVTAIQAQTAREQAIAQATAMAAIVPPTPTPIINVPVLVLPSGHVYEGNGLGRFNLDEVPAQYRAQYQAYLDQLPVARPTPQPEGPIQIRIPAISVNSNVVYGDDPVALEQGVGHHIGSTNPGQVGNMVLSAHNDIYGEIFRDLDQLEPGDQLVVSTVSRDYIYVVEQSQIVNPSDVWVLEAQGNTRRLTLISCYPYRVNNKRIVVFATLQS